MASREATYLGMLQDNAVGILDDWHGRWLSVLKPGQLMYVCGCQVAVLWIVVKPSSAFAAKYRCHPPQTSL